MRDRRRQLRDRGGEDWDKGKVSRLAAARLGKPSCSKGMKFKQGDAQRGAGSGLLYTLCGGTRED